MIETDVLILGDSTGACAAAMQLNRLGVPWVMTVEDRWIGGQLTSQAVPPDEHPWIEETGSSALYREFRERCRQRSRDTLNLTPEAMANPLLNPGKGFVSRICVRPAIAAEVLEEMVGPGRRVKGRIESLEMEGRRIREVTVVHEGQRTVIRPKMILEATDTGELLELLPPEHWVVGADGQDEHGEPHAPATANPACIQPVTWVCALQIGEPGPPVARPASYHDWAEWSPPDWPGRLFGWKYPNVQTGETSELPLYGDWSWFSYRQIVHPDHEPAEAPATLVNWPQNDQMKGPSFGPEMERLSRELTLSWVHYLQTEASHPELSLRGDLVGTADGLAQAPYIRESRRTRAVETLREQDVAADCHPGGVRMPRIANAMAVGSYRIDLHPRIDGSPTLDLSSLPFQIPLGSFVPREISNLIPACKNIGVTHIANGCTRLHPVEWCIGEAAAVMAAWCLRNSREVQECPAQAADIQDLAARQGLDLDWPESAALRPL